MFVFFLLRRPLPRDARAPPRRRPDRCPGAAHAGVRRSRRGRRLAAARRRGRARARRSRASSPTARACPPTARWRASAAASTSRCSRGESAPIAKRRGDALCAGSLVIGRRPTVRVTRVGADTVVAGIVALVTARQATRPRLARAGERAAARFVARMLVLTACTAVGWALVDPARAFAATVAVLVVSCPCAFALAAPAAMTRALAVLTGRGRAGGEARCARGPAAVDARRLRQDRHADRAVRSRADRTRRLRGIDRDAALATRRGARAGQPASARARVRRCGARERCRPWHVARKRRGPRHRRRRSTAGAIGLAAPTSRWRRDRSPPGSRRCRGAGRRRRRDRGIPLDERLRPGARAAVDALAAPGIDVRDRQRRRRSAVAAVAAAARHRDRGARASRRRTSSHALAELRAQRRARRRGRRRRQRRADARRRGRRGRRGRGRRRRAGRSDIVLTGAARRAGRRARARARRRSRSCARTGAGRSPTTSPPCRSPRSASCRRGSRRSACRRARSPWC